MDDSSSLNAIKYEHRYKPSDQVVSIHVGAIPWRHPQTPKEVLLIEDEDQASLFVAHLVLFARVQGDRAGKRIKCFV